MSHTRIFKSKMNMISIVMIRVLLYYADCRRMMTLLLYDGLLRQNKTKNRKHIGNGILFYTQQFIFHDFV